MDGTGKAGLGTEVMSGHILSDFKDGGKSKRKGAFIQNINCGSNFISKLQIKIICSGLLMADLCGCLGILITHRTRGFYAQNY